MAEPDYAAALPFDPAEEPPVIVPEDATPQERADAAAHAHYYHTRQAMDLIATSAYQARMAGVDSDTVKTVELQAMADHELDEAELDEPAEIVDVEAE